MSAYLTRPAQAAELQVLWPAARAARLFGSLAEFTTLSLAEPWCIRVTDEGEAAVVGRWRAHLDLMAIRGLWGSPQRIPALIDDLARVARERGCTGLISPLLAVSALEPYESAGMRASEQLVALQAFIDDVRVAPVPDWSTVRPARGDDLDQLQRLDAECFSEFWRYGAPELVGVLASERVTVVTDAKTGHIVGYATLAVHGASGTLGRLAVSPLWRRQGVGGALVSHVARSAAEKGATALALCTQRRNETSRALYRAMGLTELDEPYVLAAMEVER